MPRKRRYSAVDAHLFAAQVGGAPITFAQDGVRAVDGSVVVGARVTRAECLTTLLFLALAVVALHIVGVFDRSVAVGAADGVAIQGVGLVISCMMTNRRSAKY